MTNLHQTVTEISGFLSSGDFRGGIAILNKFELSQQDAPEKWLNAAAAKSLGPELAATLAEILFYCNRNVDAQFVLKAGIPSRTTFLMDTRVAARAKLQLVEYYYSKRKFESAKRMALRVLLQCERIHDSLGIAEASYYLSRCNMRLNDFDAGTRYAHRSLLALTQAREKGAASATIRWRTGLVLLVGGFIAWDAGKFDPTAQLCGALQLLEDTGDVVAASNARHTLGTVMRSQSRSSKDLDKALGLLEKAANGYEDAGHRLNHARVLTNIGRTHLLKDDVEAAHTALNSSLEEARLLADKGARRRQVAETLVWLSWYHQEVEPPNYAEAFRMARAALTEATGISERIAIEAKLAMGTSQIGLRQFEEAETLLFEAADQSRFPKLTINAELSLVELHSNGTTDIGQAIFYYQKAVSQLSEHSSEFLLKRARELKSELERQKGDFWLVAKDMFQRRKNPAKWPAIEKSLQRWAVEAMEQNSDISLRARAKKFGMSAPGYLKLRKRVQKGGKVRFARTWELPPVPGRPRGPR